MLKNSNDAHNSMRLVRRLDSMKVGKTKDSRCGGGEVGRRGREQSRPGIK